MNKKDKLEFAEVMIMKEGHIISVISFGLCAIIWTVRAVFDIINTAYTTTPILLVLDVVNVICWIVAFIVQLKKYMKFKKKE